MTNRTWDCCDPCALLIDTVTSLELSGVELPEARQRDYIRTLDCYGWLDETGRPDTARANRIIHASQSAPNSES